MRGITIRLEERTKWLGESLDKLDKLMERWDQRLTFDNLALAERYLKGELRVDVHTRERVFGRCAEGFCAIFIRTSENSVEAKFSELLF